MIKVRIGNDIRLNVTLKGTLDFDQANIKQVRCYFINREMDDQLAPPYNTKRTFDRLSDPETKVMDLDGSWYSIGELDPYPIDDLGIMHPLHHPDIHHVDMCGPHGYNFGPWNEWHEYPHHPYYWDALGYPHDHHHSHWHLFDRRLRHERPIPPHFGEWRRPEEELPILTKDPSYLAPCKILDEKNRILVYFPAEQQFFCGTYNLVITLITYEAGWGPKNLRERTIEYDDVISIVDNSTGVDQDVEIEINENGDPYRCAVGFAPILPPLITVGNANPEDQKFESPNDFVSQGVQALYKYIPSFEKLDIITKTLTFNPSNAATDNSQYLWVVSQRPVYDVLIEDSNISAPLTRIGQVGDLYYYAIPNSLAYKDEIKVTVYFEKSSSTGDFLGLILSMDKIDTCDCENIPITKVNSIIES